MKNFWLALERPFFALAPMEDVTDAAFRPLIALRAAPRIPRVFYTEFTSADGLVLAPEEGKRKLMKKLESTQDEKPIVAQLFSSVPEHIERASHLCADLGFDGVDINMGCPDRAIERQGCGAALIRTPERAQELIRAARRGARGLPISVKTRIGYATDELETWLPALLAESPACIVLHARTRDEMSDVPARWDRIRRAVEIRDALGSETLIGGNGDVRDLTEAREKVRETRCDGVMLGRAVFGNPWLFASESRYEARPEERIAALIEHIDSFKARLSGFVSDAVMKRHFKAYIGGWEGAAELRGRLMEAATLSEAATILRDVTLCRETADLK